MRDPVRAVAVLAPGAFLGSCGGTVRFPDASAGEHGTDHMEAVRLDAHLPVGGVEDLLDSITSDVVTSLLGGQNVSVYSLGIGSKPDPHKRFLFGTGEEPGGLLPRVLRELFMRCDRAPNGWSFSMDLSGVELLGESARDLIHADGPGDFIPANVLQHPVKGPVLENACLIPVLSLEEGMEMVKKIEGEELISREMGQSHLAAQLILHSIESVSGEMGEELFLRVGMLGLGVINLSPTGSTSDGSVDVLGRCVSSMTHTPLLNPPWRDSSLTWLLADGLGGNSHSLMVVFTPPEASTGEVEATAEALRLAGQVVNGAGMAKTNADPLGIIRDRLSMGLEAMERDLADPTERKRVPEEVKEKASLYRYALDELGELARDHTMHSVVEDLGVADGDGDEMGRGWGVAEEDMGWKMLDGRRRDNRQEEDEWRGVVERFMLLKRTVEGLRSQLAARARRAADIRAALSACDDRAAKARAEGQVVSETGIADGAAGSLLATVAGLYAHNLLLKERVASHKDAHQRATEEARRALAHLPTSAPGKLPPRFETKPGPRLPKVRHDLPGVAVNPAPSQPSAVFERAQVMTSPPGMRSPPPQPIYTTLPLPQPSPPRAFGPDTTASFLRDSQQLSPPAAKLWGHIPSPNVSSNLSNLSLRGGLPTITFPMAPIPRAMPPPMPMPTASTAQALPTAPFPAQSEPAPVTRPEEHVVSSGKVRAPGRRCTGVCPACRCPAIADVP